MQKVVFVSNYPNFHQLGLWDEFIKNDVDFLFLATEHISEERKAMHYEELSRPYIKYTDDLSLDELNKVLQSADEVIVGHIGDKRVYKALKNVKKIYFNNEHFIKEFKLTNFIVYLKRIYLLHFYLRKIDKYALCNSYYAGKEYRKFFLKRSHILKFGYFPELKIEERTEINHDVLFSGRCLDWKRPDLAINGFNSFINCGGKATFVGEGPYLGKTHSISSKLGIKEKIIWKPFLTHEELMQEMQNNSFYLFTSNREEGWGVVLNEALSNGMIVVANKNAGATNILIEDGVNGFIFNGSKKDLFRVINRINKMDTKQLLKISHNASNCIQERFNNVIAANRLFKLLNGASFEDGILAQF